jgi:hypothetical protein
MDDAELYILSIFKGNKDKEKYILDDQEENDINSQIYKKAKKINECEKIFLITKVNKKDKEKYLNENSESNKNNENSENENNSNELNENENNISENNKMIYENSIEENKIKSDRKILKENILADKKDMNLLTQKEIFINKCLDSKDPKDLVKLLSHFGNDINFKVNDLKILKKYQYYLGLDIDNSEDNNDYLKKKEIKDNLYSDNSMINKNQNLYPYIFSPSNNGFQFNPLYNSKLLINPSYMKHY